MGLLTGLLTLPLAPVRGVAMVAEVLQEEAERELAAYQHAVQQVAALIVGAEGMRAEEIDRSRDVIEIAEIGVRRIEQRAEEAADRNQRQQDDAGYHRRPDRDQADLLQPESDAGARRRLLELVGVDLTIATFLKHGLSDPHIISVGIT